MSDFDKEKNLDNELEKDQNSEELENPNHTNDGESTSDDNDFEIASENNKDYDLDYFSPDKKSHTEDDIDLMPGDNVAENMDFDLNNFSNQTGDINDDSFDFSDANGENSDQVDLSGFGKKRTEMKKESRKKSQKAAKRIVKKVIGTIAKFLVSVVLIGVITGCLVVGAFLYYAFNWVPDKVDANLDDMVMQFTTTVYIEDKATGEFVEYKRLHGEQNRVWADFDKIPDNLKNAFIAVEDQRFRDHQGVDWKRTAGAFVNMFVDLYSSNQGGSTITQQLVKNITGDNKQTPMRKIREIMRARYLEANYEKDTILECYLNTICLGGGIYGVEVAANYYFGKSVEDLTLEECAAIASLAKEPEKYRPDLHPETNKQRRNLVLKLMSDQGYITKETYEASKAIEVKIVADESAKSNDDDEVYNYFLDAMIEEVIDGLVEEYGMDKTYASKYFYTGGFKIYCTLDPEIQTILEEEYLKAKDDPNFNIKSKETGKTPQSAMTIMDYEGHILGVVGGIGEKTDKRGYNRATMAQRQPGSTMKPLATYSQALQKNLINYSSLVDDKPLDKYYPNGGAGPKNSYSGYKGTMILAEALERSTNTIPCHLLKKMGVESTYYYLANKFGISNLSPAEDMNLSALGLGGTYKGISTTQSAAAFAVFGNKGNYYEPTTITMVTDQRDKVILKPKDKIAAIDENTATIMNHLLQNVVYGENGTARSIADFSKTIKCYAKTGTSSDVYDSWLAGGTPYYVGSCWFGYDNQEKLNKSDLAKRMWKNVMSRIHKDLEPKEFEESEFVTNRYYCLSTGMLATDACEHVEPGWYKTNYSLPSVCSEHAGNVLPEVGYVPPEGEETIPPEENTSQPSESTSSVVSSETTSPSESASADSSSNVSSEVMSSEPTDSEPITSESTTSSEPSPPSGDVSSSDTGQGTVQIE